MVALAQPKLESELDHSDFGTSKKISALIKLGVCQIGSLKVGT